MSTQSDNVGVSVFTEAMQHQLSFERAFKEARGRPGMGSLRFVMQYNPYECGWVYEAEINFADNSRYKHKSANPDECLNNVAEQVRAIPIQWEKLV